MSHVEDNDAVKTINRQIEQMKKRAETACIFLFLLFFY